MFSRAYSFIFSEWKFLSAIVLVLSVFGFLVDQKFIGQASTGSFIVDALITFSVMRSILFNVGLFAKGNGSVPREYPKFTFFVKFLSIFFLVVLGSFFTYYLTPWWKYIGNGVMFIMTFALVSIPMFALVFTFFGSWLAADVYGQHKSLTDSFARGADRFLVNYVRSLAVVVVQIILSLAVIVFVPKLLTHILIFGEPKHDLFQDAVINILASIIRVVGNVTLAVQAAMMYLAHLEPRLEETESVADGAALE